ncbi:hypothetical protein VIN01S_22040 [Vibrio inusitatus NBRC 102082]|uniref:HTH merR-type domain-containing protein n=1 Tax=Vibrio inusitatus NBRC 102082 TaxID=1219070 RepID=A0A4Y3HXG4_9VIBR|nr:hypothetical protein [Vibrio inusitatus]GEA51400.1 hypothetical protein VIN01S_22040 [Vibrio inusitatus NBRC 102082]
MLSHLITTSVPFVTFEEYSRLTGIPVNTVKDYARRGLIIIKTKDRPGEKPLVNMVAMRELAAREALEKLGSNQTAIL